MSDILNPYDQRSAKAAPGVRYQQQADMGAEIAHLFGLDLTPRGREALAVLIGEVEAWWQHSGHTLDAATVIATFMKLSSFKHILE